MFQHFLITRFNLPLAQDERTQEEKDTWLRHRLDLFERFTFPSVQAQTNKKFQWLVYFDSATSTPLLQRFQRLVEGEAYITLILLNSYQEFRQDAGKHVLDRSNGQRYVVTTRLDNDDCLHQEYIEEIQKNIVESERSFLNFPMGYCWNCSTPDQLVTRYNYYRGPFLTLIEAIKKDDTFVPKTVSFYDHWHVPDEHPVHQITTFRAWIQLIHGENIANQMRGNPVPNPEKEFLNFQIQPDQVTINHQTYLAAVKAFKKQHLKARMKSALKGRKFTYEIR